MRRVLGILALAAATSVAAGGVGCAQPTPFPDVPPWHWAYQAVMTDQAAGLFIGYPASPAALVQNSLVQVFDGFVHARAQGAQAWVDRFTYNRPANWPAPLQRSSLVAFALGGISVTVSGDTATASFVATQTVRGATGSQTVRSPMHVQLRLSGQDWQVDYATLAAGSPVFRSPLANSVERRE